MHWHLKTRSPISPPAKYDFWRGELDLINPEASSTDDLIREFLQVFTAGSAWKRFALRTAVPTEQCYELLTFSRRMAVFGLRSGDAGMLRLGMSAVAVVDTKRVDERDVLMALSLLHHAAERTAVNARSLFQESAQLACSKTAAVIREFLARPSEGKDIRAHWGFDEVQTHAGLGFIGRGFQPYQPCCDLARAAIGVAEVIGSDQYRAASVSIATDIPHVWFAKAMAGEDRARKALANLSGAATVHGKLAPQYHPRSDAQQLMVFVAECANAEDSTMLRSLVPAGSQTAACIGISEDRLFSLVVGRSFVHGVESYERVDALERFRRPIGELLRRLS